MTPNWTLLLLVQAGEPGRQPLYGSLKLRVEVDEGTQLISEPGERDLILAPPRLQLLDTPIGEVHACFLGSARAPRESDGVAHLCECGLHQGSLLLQMDGR
jgi:hypothetical protein